MLDDFRCRGGEVPNSIGNQPMAESPIIDRQGIRLGITEDTVRNILTNRNRRNVHRIRVAMINQPFLPRGSSGGTLLTLAVVLPFVGGATGQHVANDYVTILAFGMPQERLQVLLGLLSPFFAGRDFAESCEPVIPNLAFSQPTGHHAGVLRSVLHTGLASGFAVKMSAMCRLRLSKSYRSGPT